MNARHRYLVYGLVIESELPLTSVHEAAGDDGGADITLLAGSPDYFRSDRARRRRAIPRTGSSMSCWATAAST